MNHQVLKKIFAHQIWHLIFLCLLFALLYVTANKLPSHMTCGNFAGASTVYWFYLALMVPILHQIYVWLIWRLELYSRFFSKKLGFKKAFFFYACGFSILFVSRMISLIMLAISNTGSLRMIDQTTAYCIAFIVFVPSAYCFYSLARYFSLKRAFGIDHFVPGYQAAYVKAGIFKYTSNGMYIFGLLVLLLPGLILRSQAALVVAVFNLVYIWVHYFTLERPDMREIYVRYH